jgi:hypothetical protein
MESPRRRNGPPQFLTGLALLCVLLFALLLLIRQIDPQEREARQTLAYRQAQLEATLEPIDLFAAAIWRLLPPALIIAAGATGLAIAWRRWGWRESIAAGYTIEAIRADRQQLPTSLHTLNYHSAPRYSGAPALIGKAEPEPEPVEADAPSMTELLREGRVGRGNPLMLGYEQGREITGSWLDLYATITAGLPGTGKTTTQRFFAAQTALHGARFAVADPHAGAAEDSLAATLDPLRGIYLCDPAEEPRQILELARHIAHIGEQRVRGRDLDRTPIVFWLDELTGLLGRSDIGPELAEVLERIAQEYRKRHIYLSASGQIWTAARATSELRDSFASVVCHRMKPQRSSDSAPGRPYYGVPAAQQVLSLYQTPPPPTCARSPGSSPTTRRPCPVWLPIRLHRTTSAEPTSSQSGTQTEPQPCGSKPHQKAAKQHRRRPHEQRHSF